MRMPIGELSDTKRPVNLSVSHKLLARARVEGLNLSALAEDAIAAALARSARQRLEAEIASACQVHELYLAEYGSLGEAIRTDPDAAE